MEAEEISIEKGVCEQDHILSIKTKGNNSKIRKWRVMVFVQYTFTH